MLQSQALWPDPVVAALPPDHRLAGRKRVALADLAQDAFVMLRTETSAFARELADTCARAGLAQAVAQRVAEVPAQLALVAAGLGVALVPKSACGHFGARIAVCALPASVGSGTVYAVTRRDDGNRALQAFLRTAAQMAAR